MTLFRIIGADGKEYGPAPQEQVRQWIREGRVNARSRVLPEGAAGWTELGELTEFEDVLGRRPERVLPIGAHSLMAADVLERDYDLDILSCISRAMDLLRDHFGLIFGTTAVFLLIQGFIWALGCIPFIGPLFSLGSMFAVGQLMAGVYLVILKALRGQPTELGEMFAGFKTAYLQLLLCYIVIALLAGVAALPGAVLMMVPVIIMAHKEALDVLMVIVALFGLIVFILPLVYLTVIWMFGLPLVIDKGLGFWQAMETSRKVVNRHWLTVFGLFVVTTLINGVGLLLCCIGLFLTFPLCMAINMCAYEVLFSPNESRSS